MPWGEPTSSKGRSSPSAGSPVGKSAGDFVMYDELDRECLFKTLERLEWSIAVTRIAQFPEEVSQWIVRNDERGSKLIWRRQAIHEACIKQATPEVVMALIDSDASCARAQDNQGRSPLHYAAIHGAPVDVLHLLVHASHESVGTSDFWNKLPRDYANETNYAHKGLILNILSQIDKEAIAQNAKNVRAKIPSSRHGHLKGVNSPRSNYLSPSDRVNLDIPNRINAVKSPHSRIPTKSPPARQPSPPPSRIRVPSPPTVRQPSPPPPARNSSPSAIRRHQSPSARHPSPPNTRHSQPSNRGTLSHKRYPSPPNREPSPPTTPRYPSPPTSRRHLASSSRDDYGRSIKGVPSTSRRNLSPTPSHSLVSSLSISTTRNHKKISSGKRSEYHADAENSYSRKEVAVANESILRKELKDLKDTVSIQKQELEELRFENDRLEHLTEHQGNIEIERERATEDKDAQIANLKKQIEKQKRQSAADKSMREKLKDAIDSFSEKINEQAELAKSVEYWKSHADKLSAYKDEAEERESYLEELVQLYKVKSNDLEFKYNDFKEQVDVTMVFADESAAKIKELEGHLTSSDDIKEELESQIEMLNKQTANSEMHVYDYSIRAANLEEELCITKLEKDALEKDMPLLKEELKEANETIDEISSKNEQMKGMLSSSESQGKMLEVKVTELRAELTDLLEEKFGLETIVKQYHQETSHLKKNFNQLTDHFVERTSDMVEVNSSVKDLESKVEALTQLRHEAENMIESLESTISEHEDAHSSLENEYRICEEELKRSKEVVEYYWEKVSENERLSNQVHAAETEREHLQTMRDTAESGKQILQEQLGELIESLTEAQERIKALEDEIDEERKRASSLELSQRKIAEQLLGNAQTFKRSASHTQGMSPPSIRREVQTRNLSQKDDFQWSRPVIDENDLYVFPSPIKEDMSIQVSTDSPDAVATSHDCNDTASVGSWSTSISLETRKSKALNQRLLRHQISSRRIEFPKKI
uniref:Uncharacterized protein n=1 Tax=Chaetoceros debilis TaxID=122233 RepID=A0A7S3Q188_9STRA